MDPFTLETTVYRIGGTEWLPRSYGPWSHVINPAWEHVESVPALGRGNNYVHVRFSQWARVRPDLLSARLRLEGMSGEFLGERGVLVCPLPYDVALYANIIPADPDLGIFCVGLRVPRSVWTAEDVDTAGRTLKAQVDEREGAGHGAEQVADA
jgi:hypothetical protein